MPSSFDPSRFREALKTLVDELPDSVAAVNDTGLARRDPKVLMSQFVAASAQLNWLADQRAAVRPAGADILDPNDRKMVERRISGLLKAPSPFPMSTFRKLFRSGAFAILIAPN